MTQTTTRTIPATTAEACDKYRANVRGCDCADKMKRGGSYTMQGFGSVCKHQAFRITERAEQMAAQDTQAARATRAINTLFPQPARKPALVDDGLSHFFGYQRLVPAPQPAKSEVDDLFACFELV